MNLMNIRVSGKMSSITQNGSKHCKSLSSGLSGNWQESSVDYKDIKYFKVICISGDATAPRFSWNHKEVLACGYLQLNLRTSPHQNRSKKKSPK